jgi:hypothetical protein
MPYAKLQFKPGINREVTSYTNEGGWYDGDRIRFRFGFPEKIKGWVKQSPQSFLGSCRALLPWVTLNQDRLIGVGTSVKYYINRGGGYNDITPLRETTTAGAVTFTATDGDYVLEVSDTAHGAVEGDFVTFSGAASLGGNITAGVLNQEYQIVNVVDADTYHVEARLAGTTITSITINGELDPTYVTANSSDSGDGGASVVGAYQINTGLDTTVFGAGWGVGPWSRGAWGSASTSNLAINTLRLWSHDPYGEDLLMNVRDGGIYYWDASAGLTTRAVALNSLAGSTAAPTIAKQILVSDRDRHVIAFGCDPEGTPGVQDPLTIRFSSQESLTQWASTATTTAGELRLGSGSEIVCALETRQQILVFTDTTLYAMQYLGPPFTFGVGAISESISIRSPNSAASVNDMVFWMGRNEFYVYGGTVERLPCTVRDYVFDNFNEGQAEKVVSGVNTTNSEVWWFYPSATSESIDRYVIYNYLEQCWYYGNLGRTAWVDRGVLSNPLAASADGYLYEHELGFDDGSTSPASAIAAYIDSSPIDIGEGDQFMFIDRMIPDLSFENTASANPTVAFALSVQNYPFGSYSATTSQNFTRTQVVPVTVATELLFYRLRGRQMSLKVSSSGLDMTWRLGSPRVSLRPDGRR